MRRLPLAVVLALAGVACGGGVVRPRAQTPRGQVEREDLPAERVAELETQLALARSEVRDLRAELATARAEQQEERARTVVIGGRPAVRAEPLDPAAPPTEDDPPQHEESASTGPRPLLRIYGEPPRPAIPPPIAGEQPWMPLPLPPGLGSLPVVPLPGGPAPISSTSTSTTASTAASTMADPAVLEYREALALVRDRAFDRAIAAFTAFVGRHPGHPYADNAVYWRAEAHYARREYPRALAEFESVVRRYPDGNKVADALLKIGLCHLRMGDVSQARTFFRRVRAEFPDSVAARLASREDAS